MSLSGSSLSFLKFLYWRAFQRDFALTGPTFLQDQKRTYGDTPPKRDEVCRILFEKKANFGQKFEALSSFGDFTPPKKKACCQKPHGIGLCHWLTRGQNEPNHAHSLVHCGQASSSLTIFMVHSHLMLSPVLNENLGGILGAPNAKNGP